MLKIGSNTALHCFVSLRKLIYSINVVYEVRKQNIWMYLLHLFYNNIETLNEVYETMGASYNCDIK